MNLEQFRAKYPGRLAVICWRGGRQRALRAQQVARRDRYAGISAQRNRYAPPHDPHDCHRQFGYYQDYTVLYAFGPVDAALRRALNALPIRAGVAYRLNLPAGVHQLIGQRQWEGCLAVVILTDLGRERTLLDVETFLPMSIVDPELQHRWRDWVFPFIDEVLAWLAQNAPPAVASVAHQSAAQEPTRPETGASADAWFQYFYECRCAGIRRIDLTEIAKMIGYSYGNTKHKWQTWAATRNTDAAWKDDPD